LAIECDEFNHKAHDPEDERKREREIREYLGCRFFRYNPDDKNFNMFRMIGQVRKEIAFIEQQNLYLSLSPLITFFKQTIRSTKTIA
jgi:hypothetical protein